jgi:hypothetical protein
MPDNLANIAARMKKPHGSITDLYVGGNMGSVSNPNMTTAGLFLPPPPSLTGSTFKDF